MGAPVHPAYDRALSDPVDRWRLARALCAQADRFNACGDALLPAGEYRRAGMLWRRAARCQRAAQQVDGNRPTHRLDWSLIEAAWLGLRRPAEDPATDAVLADS